PIASNRSIQKTLKCHCAPVPPRGTDAPANSSWCSFHGTMQKPHCGRSVLRPYKTCDLICGTCDEGFFVNGRLAQRTALRPMIYVLPQKLTSISAGRRPCLRA